jgi:altronate hydrolase
MSDSRSPVAARHATVQLNPADNVAIALVPLELGESITADGRDLRVRGRIPAGHKVALVDLAPGAAVLRSGEAIGKISRPVFRGDHVHLHNLAFDEGALTYEFPAGTALVSRPSKPIPAFLGYPREDGRVGTRNYIAVAAASNCAAHTAELVAARFRGAGLPEGVDGVVAFPHGDGCGHAIGPDTRQLHRTIAGVLAHPNVAAAVIIGLGCEVNLIDEYFPSGTWQTDRLTGFTLQRSGGTRTTVEAAVASVNRHIERAAAMRRVEVPASGIVLGLNCGGSDSFSGISANPALGVCSDLLVEIGATAVLAETPEIFGAEHLLVRRARNRFTAEKLLACIARYREYLGRFGGSFDDNPSPGNKEGGLSNIVEKSLGAVAKGGSSTLMHVVDYAEPIPTPGLVFMNTPGYDPVSLTGLAAGGVNLIAFTTGRGSAIGFPTVPVVKIAANTAIFGKMRDNMDVNAGRILEGEATLEEVGREIFGTILKVASGQRTASERLGHGEFVPWRIGPVL